MFYHIIWYLICGIVKKITYLFDEKVKKKNKIFEYYTSSLKGYNEEDTRSINEKLPKPINNWERKPEDL